MDNYSSNKPSYQLNNFINSPLSYELKLTPFKISILYILVRYLEMPRGICCLSQRNFARETRMSERQFRDISLEMLHEKLILRYLRGRNYFYELGEIITGIICD